MPEDKSAEMSLTNFKLLESLSFFASHIHCVSRYLVKSLTLYCKIHPGLIAKVLGLKSVTLQ